MFKSAECRSPKASVFSLTAHYPHRLLQAAARVVGWVSHPLEIRAFSRRTKNPWGRAVSRGWPLHKTANFRLPVGNLTLPTSGDLQSDCALCPIHCRDALYDVGHDLPLNTSGISGVDLPAHHKFLVDGQQVPANWRFVQPAAYVLLSFPASKSAPACE